MDFIKRRAIFFLFIYIPLFFYYVFMLVSLHVFQLLASIIRSTLHVMVHVDIPVCMINSGDITLSQ